MAGSPISCHPDDALNFEPGELTGMFAPPAWLRALGLMAWGLKSAGSGDRRPPHPDRMRRLVRASPMMGRRSRTWRGAPSPIRSTVPFHPRSCSSTDSAPARFEGQLVGALERIESGGALRIRDALFVQNNAETGELEAVAVRGDGAGGLVAPLIGFRLDPAERRRATRRALSSASATTVHHLGAELGEGEAMAVVLVEHVWARALEDAVARLGGTPVVREFVDASALAELSAEKL